MSLISFQFLSPSNSPWTHEIAPSFSESSDVPPSSSVILSAGDDLWPMTYGLWPITYGESESDPQ